jgi:hypothetical protein
VGLLLACAAGCGLRLLRGDGARRIGRFDMFLSWSGKMGFRVSRYHSIALLLEYFVSLQYAVHIVDSKQLQSSCEKHVLQTIITITTSRM